MSCKWQEMETLSHLVSGGSTHGFSEHSGFMGGFHSLAAFTRTVTDGKQVHILSSNVLIGIGKIMMHVSIVLLYSREGMSHSL